MFDSDRKALAAQIAREEARLTEIAVEQAASRQRLDTLRAQLETPRQPAVVATPTPQTNAEKVALFRSLFRGRTDVFPKYWQNPKKETVGYAPACANEWVRGVCEKPRVKCGECPNQAFIAVTDRVISDHLSGRHTAGVYPLLEDETCWFLALDFDKADWETDVAVFGDTCQQFGLTPAVERSRSGNGVHVWFFFSSAVPAGAARNMGCYLITETMTRRDKLPMSSYDRLFPNQDTMPRGGFGNLIALPLQYAPRQEGNTVFVDESLTPYADQWVYLAGLPRVAPSRVTELAREAVTSGQVTGARIVDTTEEASAELTPVRPSRRATDTIDGPLPSHVRVLLAAQLLMDKEGMPPSLIHQIKRLATFENPEFHKKQAMRLSTALIPRVICCAEDAANGIGLPRGCLPELEELMAEHGIEIEIDDRRFQGEPVVVDFHGELTGVQQEAVQALLAHDIGVFVAPPGTGKTVVGTHLVARRARSTLILVHRTQLLDQWRTQLSVFLDLKPGDIGQIGGGKRKVMGDLDVAMLQSLARRDEVENLVSGYGHVIVDECHHVPAVSFEKVMRKVRARYITGLTATPQRRDGHQPILHFQLGPVRFSVDPKSQIALRRFEHRLAVRQTRFRLQDGSSDPGIQVIYAQLAKDRSRNEMILDDVIGALEAGRSPILLTERRDHLDYFADQLGSVARHLVVLRGGMGVRQRREVADQLKAIPEDEERLVLATGRFIGEGFDDARLDTLFLSMPISWKGTLVQYAGRLHRQHAIKSEVRIFDYVDGEVPMLARMFEKRLKGYRSMGYELDSSTGQESSRGNDYVVEYDQEVLRGLDDEPF